MCLDDLTLERQSYTAPLGLSGIERYESIAGIEKSGAIVVDRENYILVFNSHGRRAAAHRMKGGVPHRLAVPVRNWSVVSDALKRRGAVAALSSREEAHAPPRKNA